MLYALATTSSTVCVYDFFEDIRLYPTTVSGHFKEVAKYLFNSSFCARACFAHVETSSAATSPFNWVWLVSITLATNASGDVNNCLYISFGWYVGQWLLMGVSVILSQNRSVSSQYSYRVHAWLSNGAPFFPEKCPNGRITRANQSQCFLVVSSKLQSSYSFCMFQNVQTGSDSDTLRSVWSTSATLRHDTPYKIPAHTGHSPTTCKHKRPPLAAK